MELTDILSVEAWGLFEKELFERYQLNCMIYNTSGTGITGKPNWCNDICPKIKANKNSLAAICATSNQHFMAQAKETRQAVIEECDAGFVKIAVPIFFQDEFLGTAGGCGHLPEGGEVETFLIQKTADLSEAEIESLCQGAKTLTEDQAREIAAFIQQRIAQYVEKASGLN